MSVQIQKPTKGRIVHVTRLKVTRAAVITNVFDGGRINAKPFLDGANEPTTPDHYYTIDYKRDPAPESDEATWQYPPHSSETIEVDG